MSDNVLGDAFEQLGQTAKQTVKQAAQLPGQIASDALGQIAGKDVSGSAMESMSSQAATSQKISAMKVGAQQKAQQDLSAVRANIRKMMTSPVKQQEQPPAYVSGKAGFSIEKIQKMQKMEEDSKKKPPPLPVSAKQGQGSGEIGKFVSG